MQPKGNIPEIKKQNTTNPIVNRGGRKRSGRKRAGRKRPAWQTFLWAAAILGIAALAAGWIAFRILVGAQDVSQLDEPLPASTVLYDRSGKEVSRLSPNEIQAVAYDKMPQTLIDAVTAVEDKRYFEHQGMDMWAIGRAFYANLTAGGTVQGGSTITQQLAKNVFLTHERTWTRKWNEVLLAKKIEENYDKRKIMELYLNQIYFGEGAWGIKRAAETYFNKTVDQLTLPESAMLAGLIRAPSALTPYKHPKKAKERRDLVLSLMHEQGKITKAEYDIASRDPVKLRGVKANKSGAMKYPYYVDQVIREAGALYGLTENEVLHGGLRIYTALDTGMQEAAQKVYANKALFPQSKPDQLIQSGTVLVDPRDGGIRAIIGGRGDQPFRGFNRASQLKRQPGSTMKPIAAYTPALERGYRPSDTLVDEPVDFGGYRPKNAGGTYHGEVSLYEALVHSYNVPAVKLLNEIGIDAGLEAAERFGIELTDGDRTLGLALGGLQEGVSPLDMAEAFGVYANEGARIPAHTIIRIESADGVVLADAGGLAAEQVIEPEIAHTMTAMLEGVVREGTGQAAAIAGRQVAGKTGTTEMPGTSGSGAKDNWFVGYTPQLVGAVWIGYDKTDSAHYLTTTSKAAAAVFQALMTEALDGEPVLAFPAAKGMNVKGKKDGAKYNDDDDDEKQEKKDKKDKKDKHKDKEDKKKDNRNDKDKENGKGRDKEDRSDRGKKNDND
ncbi:transglycosylase domain-containing protein [Paenibacillus spongiae]|uniref:PBP1A family penicillin-binding protein n=1 Tax=Paenibacillus spongiae TaxID=2909671 RepID=A0ABY5SG36_9BACL|nr:PBP1A family penicillin-binding protein [Paenibacillus spongiae]UVI32734.1 PBP1A family penicillin-binding protein [Paenibacillus spongiae]